MGRIQNGAISMYLNLWGAFKMARCYLNVYQRTIPAFSTSCFALLQCFLVKMDCHCKHMIKKAGDWLGRNIYHKELSSPLELYSATAAPGHHKNQQGLLRAATRKTHREWRTEHARKTHRAKSMRTAYMVWTTLLASS